MVDLMLNVLTTIKKIRVVPEIICLLKKDCVYLLMRDTQRKAETQAEGEAGSMQGARCGTRS